MFGYGSGGTHDHHEQTPFIAAVVFRRFDCDGTLVFVSPAAAPDGADHGEEVLGFAHGGGDGAGVGHFFDHAVEVRVVRGAKLAVGNAENTPETGEFHCGDGRKGKVKMLGGVEGGGEVVE